MRPTDPVPIFTLELLLKGACFKALLTFGKDNIFPKLVCANSFEDWFISVSFLL